MNNSEFYYEEYKKDMAYLENEKKYKVKETFKQLKDEDVQQKSAKRPKILSTTGISEQILGVSEKLRYYDR